MTEHDVRVGDRYIRGFERMTVTTVDVAIVIGSVMTGSGSSATTWEMTYALPLTGWTRVGREPEVAEVCVNHPLREREVGTMYCPECVDQQAANWASLTPGHAEALYTALLKEKK